MRIAIDISQIVYEGTGVSRYVRNLVFSLLRHDTKNEYVLFGASLRKREVFLAFASSLKQYGSRVRLVAVPIPPTLMDLMWNVWHVIPAEWFVGPVDVFWSSDWTQPPLAIAHGITTVHDLSPYYFPKESHDRTELDVSRAHISPNIVGVQARRLAYVAKECGMIFCDSEATKTDFMKLFQVPDSRLVVVYPGFT